MYTIRELREQKGWTQAQLGAKFKKPKSPEIICRWEKGNVVPRAQNLIELAKIFGVPVEKIRID